MHYGRLCEAYAAIEATSKRLEKTALIADVLREADEDLDAVILLLQGRLFPAWQKEQIGISGRLMLRALARVTGETEQRLERAWSETGDLGLVAERHIGGKTQRTLFTKGLTVQHALSQLRKLASIAGTGSVDTKLKIVSELLSQATPLEARYLTRTVLEQLRIGIAEGTVRDAIIHAFLADEAGIRDSAVEDRDAYNRAVAAAQSAYDKTNDFTRVAQAARHGIEALTKITVTLGSPLKVMLGTKGTTVAAAMETLGTPVLLQLKYDGFRVEVHKDGDRVQVFTRKLEDVTEQFPDIVERVRAYISAKRCILDGEAIGIDPETKRYRPFQEISQRIRRKHGIAEMARKLPVDVRLFDIVHLDGKDTLELPLKERHALLQRHVAEGELFGIAHTRITSDPAEGEEFFTEALRAGTEGLFAKKLSSPYQPGVRVGTWIKIKTTMEPLDLAVVGAEWGEGKRGGWLTSYTVACRDEEGELREIGRVATGLKELKEQGFSFEEMTELLRPLIEHQEGRYVHVTPKIVLEVAYEEIQKSPSYSSGYALRFPRVLRNRTDERSPEDSTTLAYVKELYEQQHQSA